MCTGAELLMAGAALYSANAQKDASEQAAKKAREQAERQAKASAEQAKQQREQSAQEAKAMQMSKEQEMARQQEQSRLLEQINASQGGEPEEVSVDIGEEEGPKRKRQSFYSADSGSGLNI